MKKAVITAAGNGSRLLPFSRCMPKEMLPCCARARDGRLIIKPIIELAYNSLYDYGCREFCFVVNDSKRSIRDYFCQTAPPETTHPDMQYHYERICSSSIKYVQQPLPLGFGDAVLKAKEFAGGENFILQAPDDVVLSPGSDHIRRLENAFHSNDADLAFLVDSVEDPELYGVIEGSQIPGHEGALRVEHIEEKPRNPRTNLAVVATYIFRPSIFYELERTEPDRYGEIEISNAIERLVARGKCVAVKLNPGETRLDVGTPEGYVACIADSFERSKDATCDYI